MEKITWDGPKWDREVLFPANPDLADILGDMDLGFEIVHVFDVLESKFLDFPTSPNLDFLTSQNLDVPTSQNLDFPILKNPHGRPEGRRTDERVGWPSSQSGKDKPSLDILS